MIHELPDYEYIWYLAGREGGRKGERKKGKKEGRRKEEREGKKSKVEY